MLLTAGSSGLISLGAAVGGISGVAPATIMVSGMGGMVCMKGVVPVGAVISVLQYLTSSIEMLTKLGDAHAEV